MNDSNSFQRIQDEDIAIVLDDIYARIASAQCVDFDSEIAKHPDLQDELRRLLPAMEMMRDWAASESVSFNAPSSSSKRVETLPESTPLGDYRIIREIGRGGMGVVYEAQQLSLDRRVALKVLPMAAFLDERQLRRFRNEARAAAALQHPNIVSVYGVGCDRSVHFYAMDFVDGSDLAATIRCVHEPAPNADSSGEIESAEDTTPIARLSTEQSNSRKDYFRSVARIGIQVSEALQYAHDEGIIHRDIKPANLLLDQRGNIHIADFGLARAHTGEDLTWTGDLLGTVRYMSLEQIEEHERVDERTDIYSLGLTLYELLTGFPAFQAKSKASLLRDIATTSPPQLKQTLPDIHDDLATIVEKAMAKEADDRYERASDLAADLQAFLDSRSIRAKPSTHIDRLRRFSRRNPALSAALAAIFVAVTLLAAVSSALALNLATQVKQESEQAAQAKETARKQRISLYAQDMLAAGRLAEERSLVALQEELLKWVPDDGEKDLRGFEWNHLWSYCNNPALIHTFDHEIPVHQVLFIDDNQIVTGTHEARVKLLPIRGYGVGTHSHTFAMPSQGLDGFAYHPDKTLLCAGDYSGNVRVWDTTSRELKAEFKVDCNGGSTDDVRTTHLSPDGTRIAVSGGCWTGGFVHVWELDNPKPIFELSTDSHAGAHFDAIGNLLVCRHRDQNIEIYDSDWSIKKEISLDDLGTDVARMSADGSLFAISTFNRQGNLEKWNVEIWHAGSWSRLWSLDVPSKPRTVEFSQDQTHLVWGDEDGYAWLANIDAATKRVVVDGRWKLHPSKLSCITLSPDGSSLATAGDDGLVYVWDISRLRQADGPVVEYPAHEFVGNQPSVLDHRGDRVAMSMRDQGIVVWNTRTGAVENPIATARPDENMSSVSRSPFSNIVVMGFGSWPSPSDSSDRIVVWDLATEEKQEHLVPALGASVAATEVSADGRWVAVCTNGPRGLLLLDLISEQRHYPDIPAKCFRFSSGNDFLAAGDAEGMVRILDCSEMKVVDEMRMDKRLVMSVDISPDGRLVAAVGFDRQIAVFDRIERRTYQLGDNLHGIPTFVRFTPDGTRILTASSDGMARLWMSDTGDEVMLWKTPSYAWVRADFSSDGSSLAMCGLNYASVIRAPFVEYWKRMSASELRNLACQKLSDVGNQ